MDLYRFTVTVSGELTETEFERLDQELRGMMTLSTAIRIGICELLADTSFSDQSRYDLAVKVTGG